MIWRSSPEIIKIAVRTTAIHSIKVNTNTAIHLRIPFILPQQIWSAPHHFQQRIASNLPLTHPIILNGKLSRPLLHQGMGIVYQKDIIYIAEEIGCCPDQDGLILTKSVLLPTCEQIPLFIPHHYLNTSGVHDYMPNHPLCHPMPLSEALNGVPTPKVQLLHPPIEHLV